MKTDNAKQRKGLIKATGWDHQVEDKDGYAVCSVCGRTASTANRSRLTSDRDCLGRLESKEHAQVRHKAIGGADWAVMRMNNCCRGMPGATVVCESYKQTSIP